MAAKTKGVNVKRDHVVVCVRRVGLNVHTFLRGPFTKAEGAAYAAHHSRYNKDECHLESMTPIHHHERWILKDVEHGHTVQSSGGTR